ncbi:MAG: outer membrane lipoprotein-sorting protein [Bdellovibrionales bacterium]
MSIHRAGFVILALSQALVWSNLAHAATNVKDLLDKVEAQSAPPNERVQLRMVIQESDGTKKERVLSLLRKNEGEPRALIRLQKPADLKGLSLLTVSEGDKEDQWLYLPSDKKSRRILGSNKKGKFLDSEIAYEDLRISTYKDFDNKIVKESGGVVQVESKAKASTDSSYGKIVTWIEKKNNRIQKVDYYDKNGKLWKQAKFTNYQKVGSKFWRAKNVQVTNVQDKRKTQLIVQKVSVKAITDEEVSLAALED